MGAAFKGGVELGADVFLDTLAAENDGVIVATGCPDPKILALAGEDALGVRHALPFLHKVREGQSPEIAGYLLMISKLADALIDVTVGAMSDRTRSRWGKRRPYILVGYVLWGKKKSD